MPKSDNNIPLWIIIASISLASFGMLSHNAFADTVTGTISVGTQPSSIAINPDTNKIYVSDGNGVEVIDGKTNSIVATIPVGSLAITINPDTNMLYAIVGQNKVDVINGSTNQIVSSIGTMANTENIVVVNPNTNMIYVSWSNWYINCPTGGIQVINGTTNAVEGSISKGCDHPLSVKAVNPTTNEVYAVDQFDGGTWVINGTTDTLMNEISGTSGGNMAINPVTNRGYELGGNSIQVVDLTSNTIIGSIATGPTYQGGVNPVTDKIYVSDGKTTVYVINGSNNALLQDLTVGSGSSAIGVNLSTNRIYASAQAGNTVSVIDGSTPTTSQITVNSQDNNGNSINGFYTTLSQNGNQIATGFTPTSFTLSDGENYTISVANFGKYLFDHWTDTGSTSTMRTISIASNTVITAVYDTISQPPTNLAATAASSSQIHLTWNAPSNNGGAAITGYEIERSTDGGNTWSTIVANTGSTSTNYSDAGLTSNTTYTYRVSAINEVGTSNPSNVASATTPLLSAGGISVGPVTAP